MKLLQCQRLCWAFQLSRGVASTVPTPGEDLPPTFEIPSLHFHLCSSAAVSSVAIVNVAAPTEGLSYLQSITVSSSSIPREVQMRLHDFFGHLNKLCSEAQSSYHLRLCSTTTYFTRLYLSRNLSRPLSPPSPTLAPSSPSI
ncbi:hypothetical protein BU24DRAFT_66865 [Aaosphaeria arxii CBS 175.79]|uniref:Uncharacterized protein n=1 Tax=Aaosphaeria arxii CBS 175.79 TaxID=1450172 RepID=A0A6A5XAG6_9PLEO|nr:uncharacterized protein BU24DRAFT_66865 [Aaosphaeria arxii CBS 175.79]KAF2009903.1 hypothetical protein BU24DRAFT_66865 [Aaosphaeria arxii CBS 175.79]